VFLLQEWAFAFPVRAVRQERHFANGRGLLRWGLIMALSKGGIRRSSTSAGPLCQIRWKTRSRSF
jgi:hypothetical protein